MEGTKAISDALVEIFSPVTNLLGSIGDQVRVYRQLSLMRTLKRAQEIANLEGLTLNEPSAKFLVPFLEECSLEAPENTDLIDMWARLLTSSASQTKPEHNLFIRILREITKSEAALLEYIVSIKNHLLYSSGWHLEDVASDWHDSYVYIKLQNLISELPNGLNENTDFEKLEESFRKVAESPGCIIYFFSVGSGEKGIYPLNDVHNSSRSAIDDFDYASIAILKSLGLISDYVSPEFWFENYEFDVRAYYLTELGSYFIKSCTNLPLNGRSFTSN